VSEEYTVAETSVGYYEDRRSEFTAVLRPAESIDDFIHFVDTIRKKYTGMCHFCSAVRLRNPTLTEKASDDGEPSGTAGKPILQTLQRNNLMNCGIVVYRKFGGTKLGIGGLVRAYGTSARQAIENARIGKTVELISVSFVLDYSLWSKAESHIRSFDNNPSLEYTDKISVNMLIESTNIDRFEKIIEDISAGSVRIVTGKLVHLFKPVEG
jgi:uncharacterized YigZ family protein